MPSDALKPPKSSKGDVAHAVVKAGLSAIPLVGGPAVELFQMLIQPPLERRRHEWMGIVGEKLQELEDRGVDISKLQDNEEFITAAMHASQLAMRTHQKEKREALRNALMNIAVGHSPDEALQHMFFDWIDTMSSLHIQILKLFQAPPAPPGMMMGGLVSVLEHNMPSLRGSAHIYGQVWKDLYMRGLVNTDGLNVTMSGSGLAEKRTTQLGDAFLSFIAEPGKS
ncbi:hypothetical protein HFP05_02535 [Rhodanobacter denitrificans]|nr:hypothetical protein [Rhodanobacter denitrificans]